MGPSQLGAHETLMISLLWSHALGKLNEPWWGQHVFGQCDAVCPWCFMEPRQEPIEEELDDFETDIDGASNC